MPIRWVICPVDEIVTNIGDPFFDENGDIEGFAIERTAIRKSRVAVLGFSYASWISDGRPGEENGWCVCFVRGSDFSALNDDPEVIDVFEVDFEDADGFLAETMNTIGWNGGRKNRFKKHFTDRSADLSGLTEDSPLWEWLERLGDLLDSEHIRTGQPRNYTDHKDSGKRKQLVNSSPKEQRAVLGSKLLGLTPKGTWVR